MYSQSGWARLLFSIILAITSGSIAFAQRNISARDSQFGPVMTAYLGYLSNEQEVVDDRASRKEITAAYYRRNSNRITALRQMAVRIVRQSGNDYVPELEAVTADELRTIFERPPKPASLREHEVVANKFRFLGVVHSGEVFYLFARLDPYEQADLIQRATKGPGSAANSVEGSPAGQRIGDSSTRARRVVSH